jgi:hypothetical protein
MKYVSKFIIADVRGRRELLEVKAVPLESKSIKAFINKIRFNGKEGWVITSEDTGYRLSNKLYPTIKEAQQDWPYVEDRCISLLENPRIREGYDDRKNFFSMLLADYKKNLEFMEELNHA